MGRLRSARPAIDGGQKVKDSSGNGGSSVELPEVDVYWDEGTTNSMSFVEAAMA